LNISQHIQPKTRCRMGSRVKRTTICPSEYCM